MFKSLAADVLGLSDIGKILDKKDFDKADVDDYVFAEDGEHIYVVIKSKTDEYCFTNLAMIHLDGSSAVSKKRLLHRYPYKHHPVSHVRIETAGTVDLDVELKFKLADKEYSIDIDKTQIERVKNIYKALTVIGEKCREIHRQMETLRHTCAAVNGMFVLRELPEQVVLSLPDIINQTVLQVEAHYNERRKEIQNYDFGEVFGRYIKW
ncbi:MAG TPA: PH domain-containing protein [Cellvibrionaceae bacterium]|nr:PH domain-containing protein [Cellvibrionaceae bacterium]HMW49344.1 PH domain-containing protein [Cellvibrionaceae bacterium]HMW72223.1 PH domain-containing protein [Cellvibrionaceae bacterium]HMY40730.1 PH domain-containing protein [Marinagarivorans sp.]HNG60903.1 PH domain-containing protein [Cellvibrionaceae bacterium]